MNNQNEFEDLIRKFKLDDDSNAEQIGSPQEPQRRPAFNYEDDQRRSAQARSHAAAATAQRPAAQRPQDLPPPRRRLPAIMRSSRGQDRRRCQAIRSAPRSRWGRGLRLQAMDSTLHSRARGYSTAVRSQAASRPGTGGPPAAGTVRFVSISTTRLLMSRSRSALAEIRRTAAMAATITTTARPAVERGVGLRRLSCC